MALRIFGLFIIAGLAMAAFAVAVSFIIPMDTVRLQAGMLVSVFGFSIVGAFYPLRYSRRLRLFLEKKDP